MVNLEITVERSSHPDFDYFASTVLNGHQWATRGNAHRVADWLTDLLTAVEGGRARGVAIDVTVYNTTDINLAQLLGDRAAIIDCVRL